MKDRFACEPLQFSDAALSAVKWLALLLMVIDHTNKYLFEGSIAWMYAVGRVSMPLFAFALGYNLARPGMLESGAYARLSWRLALVGLLATVPFVGVNTLSGGWWPLNMMFSFLVAVVFVWLLSTGRKAAAVAACLVFAWGGALPEYWWPGIGLCTVVWAYQLRPTKSYVVVYVVCLLALWFVNSNFWALLVIPVLWGLQRWWNFRLPRAQWLFYAIYPVHLGLFWVAMKLV